MVVKFRAWGIMRVQGSRINSGLGSRAWSLGVWTLGFKCLGLCSEWPNLVFARSRGAWGEISEHFWKVCRA